MTRDCPTLLRPRRTYVDAEPRTRRQKEADKLSLGVPADMEAIILLVEKDQERVGGVITCEPAKAVEHMVKTCVDMSRIMAPADIVRGGLHELIDRCLAQYEVVHRREHSDS